MTSEAIKPEKMILLVVAGGIAAYKSLDLVRRLRDRGYGVRPILTEGGSHFVTPLTLSALAGSPVYQDLFSLTAENEMGHIRLAREADLVVVAPATADLMARMAAGMANDLASTALLATGAPILLAPTMNTYMWSNPATQANVATLKQRGVSFVGPDAGSLACGEVGAGRMVSVDDLLEAIESILHPSFTPRLAGKHVLVTSGPTLEPIDPVRFISNRSSGKQGHAIAAALAALGARVTLVSGPVALPDPAGVTVVAVETAWQMLAACEAALPADAAICAAAVADWRVVTVEAQKMKKKAGTPPPSLTLEANPDILATLAQAKKRRPRLVVGFAAETETLIEHAKAKRLRKECDWIVANDVSEQTNTFGGDANTVHLVEADGVESWPTMSKTAVAARLAEKVADFLEKKQ